jgi:hypothetical protein
MRLVQRKKTAHCLNAKRWRPSYLVLHRPNPMTYLGNTKTYAESSRKVVPEHLKHNPCYGKRDDKS